MNEYEIICANGARLMWFAKDVLTARREAEESGHLVKSVLFKRENVKQPAPGVICKCGSGELCPAHGVKR